MNISIRTFMAITMLIVYVSTAQFSINSVSTCLSQTASGFCTKWEQNGSVTQTTSCFPANAELIVLQNGQQVPKKMSELKIGDKVLSTIQNKQIYTPVIGWLHRQVQSYGKYFKIITETSHFVVSAMHNIALMDGSYSFAKDVEGKYLYNGQKVLKLQEITSQGIYAPMTQTGKFFVNLQNKQKTLAHCFANIKNPQFYQPFVMTIWNVWDLIYGQDERNQIHPAAQWMMKYFNFLVQN